MKKLVIILGPTGVGKTDLSIRVAQEMATDIISCDSRQIFQELCIGTAVPEKEYLEKIKHHLIQNRSIKDNYSASQFEFEALDIINALHKNNDVVVMTGGSMMYIDAICKGIDDMPTIEQEVRETLMERFDNEGLENLRRELKVVDPSYYDIVDLKNPKRVIHALEIYYQTGKPYSSFRTNTIKKRPFEIIKIGLNREREELYERIDRRVDVMLEEGLEAEARSVFKYRGTPSLRTVGYQEFFEYFEGNIDFDEAIRLIKRNSRRYARKQLSWFRRDDEIHWYHPKQEDEIIVDLKEKFFS